MPRPINLRLAATSLTLANALALHGETFELAAYYPRMYSHW
jgi:hypothetical protein